MTRNSFLIGSLATTLLWLGSCSKPTMDGVREFNYHRFANKIAEVTLTPKDFIVRMAQKETAFIDWVSDKLPDKEVIVESILYKTTLPNGKSVFASGIIARPKNTTKIKGVVSALHYTYGSQQEALSESFCCPDVSLAFFDYVVIMSDYIGLGSTQYLPQPYMHLENAAKVQLDMVFAAREYLKTLDIDAYVPQYVMGFSQGGAIALAYARAAYRDYPKDFRFIKIFAGSAPTDLMQVMDTYIEDNRVSNPFVIPALVIGMDYAYDLHLDYNNIFRGALLENYQEWICSKKYTAQEVMGFLNTEVFSDLVHPDFFTEDKNPDINKLLDVMKLNSITDGYFPPVSVSLMHGLADHTIPYANTHQFNQYLRALGCDVDVNPTLVGDHRDCGAQFYIAVLINLAF